MSYMNYEKEADLDKKSKEPRGHLNIKMPSNQQRDSHYKDRTAWLLLSL